MLKELEQLLVLQDRDRKLRALRQELKNIPLERRQMDERLSSTQGRLDTTKGKSRELEIERKKLENEVLTKREQIAKYQAQKFNTRKNEEFQAMNTAIEHLEADIQKIEDRELELMEGAEVLRPQIEAEDKATQATKAQVTQQHTDLDGKTATLEKQIADFEAGRAQLAEGIDEDILDRYERLFKNKGSAIVALEHDTCAGCNMKVTASTAARTKAGKEIVECEQCSRILYRGDD